MKVGKVLLWGSLLLGGVTSGRLARIALESNTPSARNIADAGVSAIRDAAKDIPQTLGETGRTIAHCPPESILCDLATGLSKAR